LAGHGAPQAILTDNGKVFTARFGPGPGPVLFDRLCHDNGIRHLLTAPYSPTTTGKIERLHKTMRRGFFDRHLFDTIEQAQAALDAWVVHYNTARLHQGIGDRPPADRFALVPQTPLEVAEPAQTSAPEPVLALGRPAGLLAITRRGLTAAASAWLGCTTSPAVGWPVSWSRSPCTTGWSRSPIVGC
jgi:Integrase core domain